MDGQSGKWMEGWRDEEIKEGREGGSNKEME
ncbi:uncharacterized, partial [Tachysurus ichikawai]